MIKLGKILKNQLLEKSKLGYAKDIADLLATNPEIIDEVLSTLEITEEEFFARLYNNRATNISFYDNALSLSTDMTKKIQRQKSFEHPRNASKSAKR